MHWGRLTFGFLMSVTAGIVLGCACSEGNTVLRAIATLALALGVLSTLWAVPRHRVANLEPGPSPDWNKEAAPRLGEMLLSYGLISEADLERALRRQQRTEKRLGRVLVEMKLVTHAQVAEVLEEQLSRREGRLLWGAGQRLIG